MNLTESTRAYIYRIGVALMPILVGYGVLAENDVASWLGLLGAVLGMSTNVLASVHTSTKADRQIPPTH